MEDRLQAGDAALEARPERAAAADEAESASAAAAKMTLAAASDVMKFEALQSAYYHIRRQARLEAWHRALLFVSILGGSAALAAVVASHAWAAAIFALLPTVAGTIDLVGDFAGRAAVHRGLYARFIDILARLEGPGAADPLDDLRRDLSRIYAEEPSPKAVVQAFAHNAAIRTLGRDPAEMLVPTLPQRLLAHVFSFGGTDIPTRRELEQTARTHASTSRP